MTLTLIWPLINPNLVYSSMQGNVALQEAESLFTKRFTTNLSNARLRELNKSRLVIHLTQQLIKVLKSTRINKQKFWDTLRRERKRAQISWLEDKQQGKKDSLFNQQSFQM